METNESYNHANIEEAKESANTSAEFFQKSMESIMIISLAGFGGALAGISMAVRQRRLPLTGLKTFQNKQLTKKTPLKDKRELQHRPYVDSHLPNQWALTCMGFASIVEIVRRMSPFELILHESIYFQPSWTKSLTIIGDYTIGGAVAGAMFKGASLQDKTNMTTERKGSGSARYNRFRNQRVGGNVHLASDITLPSNRFRYLRGLGPGMSLGFVAGCAQCSIWWIQNYVNEIENNHFGNLEKDAASDDQRFSHENGSDVTSLKNNDKMLESKRKK